MENKQGSLLSQFIYPLLVFLFVIFVSFTSFLTIKCYSAAAKLNCLQNTHELMRIKVYGASYSDAGNTVSASFSIIDSNGNEIAVFERSWSGSYLGAEFSRISLYGKNFVFPVRVFGKNRIADTGHRSQKGIRLEKYYNDYRQCMLLGHGSSLKERRELYWLSVFATKKYHLPQFSLVEYINLDLSTCKSETYYSVICDENGNLSVVEL